MPIPFYQADQQPQPPSLSQPSATDSKLRFTGQEKKQERADGSYDLMQEYQFGESGPKIWLKVDSGPPTRTQA